MNFAFKAGGAIALALAAFPLQAAPVSVWNSGLVPEQPLQYIKAAPISRIAPQIANAEIYAPESLLTRLNPSIEPDQVPEESLETNIQSSIVSKNGGFGQISPRVNLSPSYVQEFAYIDMYSNIRRYDDNITFPSVRLSLTMPRFGNGFGGGYQPLQYGFGPLAVRFW